MSQAFYLINAWLFTKNQTKNTLTYGVVVLTAANLLVKVIGLVFKIPIQGLIHDEGMGYFNVAYTIYSWLYLLSTAGLPVALSVMISGERHNLCQFFRFF